MTSVCSAYDRPRENQTGLAVRPVANVALDTDRAITEGSQTGQVQRKEHSRRTEQGNETHPDPAPH